MDREPSFIERHKQLIAGSVLAVLAVSGCASSSRYKACDKFGVVAQHRWAPDGASVRTAPDVLAPKIEPGFTGNETIAVDGWVYTTAAYPKDSPPYNSNIWFHLANREGWVAFAAVRRDATSPDITGQAYGGKPAPYPANCREDYQP
jgi:hypothetical protein